MRYCCLFLLFLLYPTIDAQLSVADLERLSNNNGDDDPADIQNKTYVEEQTALQKHLLNRYDRHSRPTSDLSKPTIVSIHLTILHFSVQEKQQSITFYGHMYMTWFDEKAVWNPADFNNVRMTHHLWCKQIL
ncbi:Neur-chan-LBD domain-containing protein [Aphelenchoides besseyi]|nr:Neur-chan-LBD domain-containing protein [Aphelenchoides besseyi]